MKLLATLGDFADEGVGRIVEIDLEREVTREVLRWTPPADLRVAGKGFTGMCWLGSPGRSELAVAAHSCVCRVDPTRWAVTGVLHEPSMNDLHHVALHGGRLLVANTGADRVDAFALDGRYLGGWDFAPASVTAARLHGVNPSRAAWSSALHPGWAHHPATPLEDDPTAGYDGDTIGPRPFHTRKVRDFVHPNHLAVVDGHVLVTRFQDQAIQNLTDGSVVVPETPGFPHDGVYSEGRFWITCTNGLVVAYALEGGRVTATEVERIDVFASTGRTGWCRGLLVTAERLIVGLTAIDRMPRYRWCDRPFDQTETSVLIVDRVTHELVGRVDLRSYGQRAKLFDLMVWP